MTNAHAPCEPSAPAEDAAAWKQAALRRQVEVVEQLSQAGLDLALALRTEAVRALEAGEPIRDDAAMAFSRVSRAVRMAALLHSRLIREIDAAELRQAGGAEAARTAAREAAEDADPVWRHKARVENIVARVARAETDDEDDLDGLINEAGERLDDDDIYGDVMRRPIGELVALICRDLGLKPDWTKLSHEAWAQAEIAQGVETSPFASLRPPPQSGGSTAIVYDCKDDPGVEGACLSADLRPIEGYARAGPS